MVRLKQIKSISVVFFLFILLIPFGSGNLFDQKLIQDASAARGDLLMPDWVRNTAKWWGEGSISDEEFLNAMQYLFDNKILTMSGYIEKDDFSS